MAVEIQVHKVALAKAVSDATQTSLFGTCFPPTADVFVDHVDVSISGVEVVSGPDQDIRILVPLDVYLVRKNDLESFANLVPPGATTPAGRIVAIYRLAVAGTVVSLSLVDLRSDPPNAFVDMLLDPLKAAIPSLPGLDASAVFTSLGLPSPTVAQAVLVGDIVAIRFDPVGLAVSHLFAGQEWGLFVDGATVVAFIQSRLSAFVVPNLTLTPRWTPVGTPSVTVDWRFKPDLPDPLTATGTGVIGVGLTLASTNPPRLRATLNWSLHIDLGSAVPGFIDNAVEKIVRDLIANRFDPQIVGGTKIDDRSFFIDQALPPLTLGGAQLRYTSLEADQSGMTIGGTVRSVQAERGVLSFIVSPFGLPTWFGTCRALAKGGSGDPPKILKVTEVSNGAGVSFSSYGAFCDASMVQPNSTAAAFLTKPTLGSAETVASVGFTIPAIIAQGITEDVKLILRTARGVRLINFGRPIVEIDAEGNVAFTTFYIDNCLYLTDAQVNAINWVKGKGDTSVPDFKPPLEDPGWVKLLTGGRGFEVQLVSLNGLEPGELLRYRSSNHAIDLTADTNGQALVPVFLPLSEDIPSTSLERVNRQSIAGKFDVKGTSFFRIASLPSGIENRLDEGGGSGARLTRVFHDRVTRDEFGSGGVPLGVQISSEEFAPSPGVEEVALNPQPLPPAPDMFASAAERIPGVRDVVAIPGFESEPLAIARMDDGSAVLLQADSSGRTRVAGSFSGPIGAISTAGDWGTGFASERTLVFEVRRD